MLRSTEGCQKTLNRDGVEATAGLGRYLGPKVAAGIGKVNPWD